MAVAAGATAAILGARRGRKAVVAFAVLNLPQLAILAWALRDLLKWQAPRPDAAAVLLLGLLALLFFHRVTSYAYRLRPRRYDLLWIIPVHLFQTTLFFWFALWPLSRLGG